MLVRALLFVCLLDMAPLIFSNCLHILLLSTQVEGEAGAGAEVGAAAAGDNKEEEEEGARGTGQTQLCTNYVHSSPVKAAAAVGRIVSFSTTWYGCSSSSVPTTV